MINSSYIAAEINLERQEGDTGSIPFIFPDAITLADFAEVIFQVWRSGEVVIDKRLSNSDGEVVVDGQNLTIVLNPADTVGHKGVNKYEIQLSGDLNSQVITVVKGNLTILKELITENS